MNVGIIGTRSPNVLGMLASMALTGNSSNGRGFRFVYKNEQDNEFLSRVFNVDSLTTRSEFLRILRSGEFNYDEKAALNFSVFKDSNQIYKEYI